MLKIHSCRIQKCLKQDTKTIVIDKQEYFIEQNGDFIYQKKIRTTNPLIACKH